GAEIFVISGGEPTLFTKQLIDFFEVSKNKNPVRIDTNGQLPDEVARLLPYCEGFAIDIKIPIKQSYSEEELERFKEILGISSVEKYAKNLSKTIKMIDGMPLTLFRTVKYSHLSDEDSIAITEFANTLKSPHYWNPYISF
ncbi:MAG: glycyl radical-activating protein, partial [Crenarchaeota archaeon]|nr:glycyl radical-activating protein [Thermoproteota archaeon]